jgi:ferritin
MVANQKIVAAINEQMGNEFSAMLQYYAIAAHFGAEALPELSAHFYKQAEEEKEHALRFIQFVIDTGARVKIPAVSAPQAHFEVAEDAVKLSLQQEEQVTTQINALVSMAKAESDYIAAGCSACRRGQSAARGGISGTREGQRGRSQRGRMIGRIRGVL